MAQTNINIRMDVELKRQFEEFCNDVGMTMSAAFNIFAKKVVLENRIPFEVGTRVSCINPKQNIVTDCENPVGLNSTD